MTFSLYYIETNIIVAITVLMICKYQICIITKTSTMAKVMPLNKNNSHPESDVLKIIKDENAQEDLNRKKWDNKISKRWNMFIFLFTISRAIISVVLIIVYVFKGITVPVVEFIGVLTTPFIPFTINRFIIFLSLFRKSVAR